MKTIDIALTAEQLGLWLDGANLGLDYRKQMRREARAGEFGGKRGDVVRFMGGSIEIDWVIIP